MDRVAAVAGCPRGQARPALKTIRNRSRGPLLPGLLLLLLPALACSGDEAPGAPSGAAAAEAAETQIIPDEALNIAEPSDRIARISDIAAAADGTVWVLNSTEPFLMAMSAEGEVLDTRGRRGDGPGEFRAPRNLLRAGRPSRVWAFDSRAAKFVRVDGPKGEVEELFLPWESGVHGERMIAWEDSWEEESSRGWIGGREDGFLIARSAVGTQWLGMWDFEVVHLTRDTSTSIVLSSGDFLGDPTVRYGDKEEFHVLPVPLWASCPDGSMVLYDPLANAVRRPADGGGETGSHALPPERLLKVTLERAFAVIYRPTIAAMGRPDGPQTEGLPSDSADLFEAFKREVAAEGGISDTDLLPEYKQLACGGSGGSLWLQIFDVESRGRSMGDGPEWLRIGPDGAMRRIVFPESFSPLRFTDDRIWGSHRGEFDVESVAWIALPL